MYVFAFCWVGLQAAYTQSSPFSAGLQGKVVDSQTNEPLAFVHIGIRGRNLGTISREDGSFMLGPEVLESGQPVTFSIVGYETMDVEATRLQTQAVVRMKSVVYSLREVQIDATRIKKRQVVNIGRTRPSKTTMGHSGYKEYGLGGEWAVEIDPDGRRIILDKLRFHLRFNTVDSILYRVNLYSLSGGLPDTLIHQQQIFATSYRGDKWIEADLLPLNLTISEPIAASIELVRFWFGESSDNQIFYTYAANPEGREFSRASSQDNWKPGLMFPLTIYIRGYLDD